MIFIRNKFILWIFFPHFYLNLILLPACVTENDSPDAAVAPTGQYSLADFELLRVIGRGSYAKVGDLLCVFVFVRLVFVQPVFVQRLFVRSY